jgi:hypothetical protein
MMQAVDNFIGPEILTLVVLLGTLIGVLLWGFFQHRPPE